jgi:hypothetical protein
MINHDTHSNWSTHYLHQNYQQCILSHLIPSHVIHIDDIYPLSSFSPSCTFLGIVRRNGPCGHIIWIFFGVSGLYLRFNVSHYNFPCTFSCLHFCWFFPVYPLFSAPYPRCFFMTTIWDHGSFVGLFMEVSALLNRKSSAWDKKWDVGIYFSYLFCCFVYLHSGPFCAFVYSFIALYGISYYDA